jgi:predicted HAD superfamily phosphohydrolase
LRDEEKICVDKKMLIEILTFLASLREVLTIIQRTEKDVEEMIPKIDEIWRKLYKYNLKELYKNIQTNR